MCQRQLYVRWAFVAFGFYFLQSELQSAEPFRDFLLQRTRNEICAAAYARLAPRRTERIQKLSPKPTPLQLLEFADESWESLTTDQLVVTRSLGLLHWLRSDSAHIETESAARNAVAFRVWCGKAPVFDQVINAARKKIRGSRGEVELTQFNLRLASALKELNLGALPPEGEMADFVPKLDELYEFASVALATTLGKDETGIGKSGDTPRVYPPNPAATVGNGTTTGTDNDDKLSQLEEQIVSAIEKLLGRKLSNNEIKRVCREWHEGKSVAQIAKVFGWKG